MPVKSVGDGISEVHQSVCPNEAIANLNRLIFIVEKNQKTVQDQRLANRERQKSESRNDDGNKRPPKGRDAAANQGVLAVLGC